MMVPRPSYSGYFPRYLRAPISSLGIAPANSCLAATDSGEAVAAAGLLLVVAFAGPAAAAVGAAVDGASAECAAEATAADAVLLSDATATRLVPDGVAVAADGAGSSAVAAAERTNTGLLLPMLSTVAELLRADMHSWRWWPMFKALRSFIVD